MPATDNDFDKDYLKPTYEYYDEDHQEGTTDAPPEQLTPTPEIGDNYLNMELMLPNGGTLARGRVTECNVTTKAMSLEYPMPTRSLTLENMK